MRIDLEVMDVRATHLRRPCAVSIHGAHAAVAEPEGRGTILDRNSAPVAFLRDNLNRKQWANFRLAPGARAGGIFTPPHGLSYEPKGILYVQDWNKRRRGRSG